LDTFILRASNGIRKNEKVKNKETEDLEK